MWHQRNASTRQAAATSAPSLTLDGLFAGTCIVHGARFACHAATSRREALGRPTYSYQSWQRTQHFQTCKALQGGPGEQRPPSAQDATFSVFSALHDTMLGEVDAVPVLCFPDLHSPQLLSSVQSLKFECAACLAHGPSDREANKALL